jgi:hypothetical protein
VLGRCEFHNEKRGCDDGVCEAETDKKTGDDELRDVFGGGLESGTDNCPGRAEDDGATAAQAVYNPGYEGQGKDCADSVDGVQEAEDRSLGFVKLCFITLANAMATSPRNLAEAGRYLPSCHEGRSCKPFIIMPSKPWYELLINGTSRRK